LPQYADNQSVFEGLNAQVLGISVDNVATLVSFEYYMAGLSYPLLSDFWPHGLVALKYGVLRPDGMSERAIFVVDRKGVIQYVDVHDINQLPDIKELFKVLRKIEGK
jgi:peroxiredoxin